MDVIFERLFRAPYSVPNALERVEEGVWIADQISDRVALVNAGPVGDYGVTFRQREIPSDCSNTSGMAVGEQALWLAANGEAALWRVGREVDAQPGAGEILKIDPATGQTLMRRPVPAGGGVHGIEYDHVDEGHLWITTLREKTLTQVQTSDWATKQVIPPPYSRAHGVVRTDVGVWVIHTSERVIVLLDTDDGRELDRIVVPDSEPEPHGLSAWDDGALVYCDATSGWVVVIRPAAASAQLNHRL